MNVRLSYNIDFLAMVYLPMSTSGALKVNHYYTKIDFLTMSDFDVNINIAVERSKIFLQEELANTIFINREYLDEIEKLKSLNASITDLPDEPLDQIIGLALYCKLNAIMEQHVMVTDLSLSSDLGDQIWFHHSHDENLGPMNEHGWWMESDIRHCGLDQAPQQDNVTVIKSHSWNKYDMAWSEKSSTGEEPKTESDGNTVYIDFRKDANK